MSAQAEVLTWPIARDDFGKGTHNTALNELPVAGWINTPTGIADHHSHAIPFAPSALVARALPGGGRANL